ncbi:MAG: PfkB family carbohydrate kinase [Rhodospirillales bacterium]
MVGQITEKPHKLRSIKELGQLAVDFRGRGETVVLAHGTFDLLHVGHLRHLKQAAREGDRLFVTITGDPFVSKGPGRPVFSEHMRAEMLAALDCVDYVGIVYAPRALEAINAVKPTVYVKGSDYKNAEDDITGGIVEERAAVESHGGRIAFTEDITFSSSSLINKHLAVFDPALDEFLESQREKNVLGALSALIDQVANLKVLMIGDAIIDDYNYVSAMGKSPKEHIIATLFNDREVFAGGVFAAANHLANFCGQVDVVTTIGDDEYEPMIRAALRDNVNLEAFVRDGCPTTRKVRFIDKSYLRKLFEVYHMDDTPTAPEMDDAIAEAVSSRIKDYDLVIVHDFGHGLMTPRMVDLLTKEAPFLAVNTQTNSANTGYNLITKYPRADYICIDAPEARLAVADRLSPIETIVSEALPSRIDCRRIMVTHGKHGCYGYDREMDKNNEGLVYVPAFTKQVVDTVGAGDAFFSVTAPLAAIGAGMDQLAFIGSAAGAIKVGIVGHRRSVERVSLLKFLTTLLK